MTAAAVGASVVLAATVCAGTASATQPAESGSAAAAHSAIPLDRVTMAALPTGHSPFEGKDLADGSRRVHAFVAGQPGR